MRRGITPVVAVIIILMMTVATSVSAYGWMRGLQEQVQAEAARDLRQDVTFKDLRCDVEAVAFSLKNSGDVTVSADALDVYIHGPDDELVTTRTGVDMDDAAFTEPGGFATRGVLLNESLVPSRVHEVEVAFREGSISGHCRVDPGEVLTNAIGNWDVADGTTPDIESGSRGGCFYVVPSPIENPINASNIIKFNSSAGATCELELEPRNGYSFEGAGAYRLSIDIRVGNAWDGNNEQFLHSRWYNTSGGEIGTTGGGFPSERDTWEHIYTTFDTGSEAPGDFNFYLGYPQETTQGVAYVTNVRVAKPPDYLQ